MTRTTVAAAFLCFMPVPPVTAQAAPRVETRTVVADALPAAGQRRTSVIHVAPPARIVEADRASIIAAVERARPGDTIQFAAGTYLVGRLIPVATSRLTLLGHADGTVLRGCEPAEYDAMEQEFVGLLAAPPDPANPGAAWDVVSRCGMMEFTGGHVTIRNFTFEYGRLGLLLGCCSGERAFRATDGGYVIEDNTFRNSGNSVRAILSSPVPTVVRNNRFINTFHALSAVGSHLHFVDNHVAVTDPAEVPGGLPGFGVSISSIPPDVSTDLPAGACDGNVIARNHVEGHPNGIVLDAAPASVCTGAEIRDNTIIVRRGPYRASWPYVPLVPLDHPSDSTIVGVPLTLWGESRDEVDGGRVTNSLVEGNRIVGAEGVGLELRRATQNRIVNNTISGVVRRDPYPGNLDGPSPEWGEEHNGSGIWVSADSDGNELLNNTFEGIAVAAIVLRGAGNQVELRNASDVALDHGSGNQVAGASARVTGLGSGSDTVHVAVPTGEAEGDRASILAALAQVQPGGTIQFASGTYQMGELLGDAARKDKMVRVTVPGVTLQGHPDGTTLRYCDPADFPEHEFELLACDGLVLEAPRQTVRGLTFEYFQEGLYVGCCFDLDAVDPASFGVGGHPGGHLIEGNTFRNSGYSIRAAGDFAEPVVIRQNRFINTVHAVGIVGSMVHFLANDISAPEPGAVRPYPSNAIVIGPLMSIFPPPRRTVDHTYCARNIVEGNRIEGHVSGIWIGTVPGSSCVGNVIRDNTIIVQRTGAIGPPPGVRMIVESDSTLIGPPLWLRPFPFDQDAHDTESGVIEDNLIEGNRIIGAEGIGIEVWNASRNRFMNNTITGVVRREPFPGNLMGDWNQAWRDANGSGIWLSPGSIENEIVGNSFADIEGAAIYIEGDRNRVETRSAADAVRDLGSGNQVTAATAIRSDTVHVAPPTGERETDRASILAAVERVLPGGTVQFAPGTYIVGRLITIATPGITLLGHPEGTTLRGCEAIAFDEVGRGMAAAWLGELEPQDAMPADGCDIFQLTGGHATVRNLTFEHAWSGLLLGCCEAEFEIRPSDGGYLIERNTFRAVMNGVRGTLTAADPTVIRDNRFVNTFHAVVWWGSRLHLLDNEVSVPDPERISAIGFPGSAIGVIGGVLPRPPGLPDAEFTDAVPCDDNVIAGNRVGGHPDGIGVAAFPGTTCRNNVIRHNTIVVSTPSFDRSRPAGRSFGDDETVPSIITGVPISLAAILWQGGSPGGVVETVVEGNRVSGAQGVGIELFRASGNRIVNNVITDIRPRDAFPGNFVGSRPRWRNANGTGIWVSANSDENEIGGNTFENMASETVVLEGDRNWVETQGAADAVRDMGTDNRVERRRPSDGVQDSGDPMGDEPSADPLDAQSGNTTEMGLVAWTHQYSEVQFESRRGDGQVVRRDRCARALQCGKDFRPALRGRQTEGDHLHPVGKRIDFRPPRGRPDRGIRQPDSSEQLGVYDSGQCHRLVAQACDRFHHAAIATLGGYERARVDYEAHGSSGGRSAPRTSSRASANPGSGSPASAQAANASRTVVGEPSGSGISRAIGSPLRSIVKLSPRYRTRESTSPSRRTSSVDEIRWSMPVIYRFAYRATSMTPLEAVRSATIVPARAMGLHHDGTVEVGKRADLIAVDGDPLRSIREIRNVRAVIANGRMFDTAALWRSVDYDRDRQL